MWWIAGLLVTGFAGGPAALPAEEAATSIPLAGAAWQEQAVEYARMMSRVQWTPVADGMPMQWRGRFEKGVQYTGVPYSNQTYQGRTIGRSIGFEIFLKTFLAAVENPESVLYTEKAWCESNRNRPRRPPWAM